MADAEYFSQRYTQECAAAETCPDPRIASIHADMAVLYQAALKLVEASGAPVPGPVPIRAR